MIRRLGVSIAAMLVTATLAAAAFTLPHIASPPGVEAAALSPVVMTADNPVSKIATLVAIAPSQSYVTEVSESASNGALPRQRSIAHDRQPQPRLDDLSTCDGSVFCASSKRSRLAPSEIQKRM